MQHITALFNAYICSRRDARRNNEINLEFSVHRNAVLHVRQTRKKISRYSSSLVRTDCELAQWHDSREHYPAREHVRVANLFPSRKLRPIELALGILAWYFRARCVKRSFADLRTYAHTYNTRGRTCYRESRIGVDKCQNRIVESRQARTRNSCSRRRGRFSAARISNMFPEQRGCLLGFYQPRLSVGVRRRRRRRRRRAQRSAAFF